MASISWSVKIRTVAALEGCHVPDTDDEPILFCEPYGRALLAIALEDELDLPDLPEEAVEQCNTVADWVALVEGKVRG
jgi:hypothetical protein